MKLHQTLSQTMSKVESMSKIRRSTSINDFSVTRGSDPDASLRFSGHAAVFDQPTLIGSVRWGFVEWIERGAFTDTLDDDVRFLINHDGIPLARTKNGTLTLKEDKIGLVARADLAPVSLSRDLATLIERGDITQMSFAFATGEERVGLINLKERSKDNLPDGISDDWDGLPFRAVTKMARLYDVSPVTYPAYEGTDAEMVTKSEVRSFLESFSGTETTSKYSAIQRAATLRTINIAGYKA